MENTTTQPRPELLQMADVLAREKGIDRDDVLQAMEYAIARAGRSKYGPQYDVRATIDRKTGEIKMARYTTVVETVEEEGAQISLQDAHKINPDLKLGDEIVDPLPPMDFGRIAAQTAKQVIVQKVRDAERVRQYNDFKDKATPGFFIICAISSAPKYIIPVPTNPIIENNTNAVLNIL